MRLTAILVLLLLGSGVNAQSIVGKWHSVDDNTGKVRSLVEIYEKSGKIFGRIVKLFPGPGDELDPICDECDSDDDRYNKKVTGMEIIRSMTRNSEGYYDSGTILDPEVGRVYRCRLWVENGNLMVRGYLGPFYRTQVWKKAP